MDKIAMYKRAIMDKAASLDAVRKKQYWQILKKMHGGADDAVKYIKETGDSGIYHGTKTENIESILKDGLKTGPFREVGKGTFFAPKETAEHYTFEHDIFDSRKKQTGKLLRLKKPSELQGTKELYPKTTKAMSFDISKSRPFSKMDKMSNRFHEVAQENPNIVDEGREKYLNKLMSNPDDVRYKKSLDMIKQPMGKDIFKRRYPGKSEDIKRDLIESLVMGTNGGDQIADKKSLDKIFHPNSKKESNELKFFGKLRGKSGFADTDRKELFFRKTDVKPELLKKAMEKVADMNKDFHPNVYQSRVINNPSGSLIIAHSVGSGKTSSSIAKFEKMKGEGKAHKALVVVPAGLRENFGAEGVAKFTNSKYNIIGNQQEISSGLYKAVDPNADYNVISYEMFRKNPKKYIAESGADTVIADEQQNMRNDQTSTFSSFRRTRHMYPNFIGMTGSIVNNGVSDVQPLVDIASGGKHDLGKSKKDFDEKWVKRNTLGANRYIRKDRRPVVGFNQPKQLSSQLSKYIDYADNDDMREIAKIPRKSVTVNKIPLSKDQLKIYRGIINKNPNIKKLIYRKKLETLKPDEIATAYNELVEARKLMNSVGSVVPGVDLKTSAKITPKTRKLLDDMQGHLVHTKDGQAILLTNLVNGGSDVLEAGLQDRHISYGKFIGKGNPGVSEESRQQAVKDFLKRKKRVMIVNGAGAEGLSLGNTTWEGLLDPHYNPERMNQMEARGVRARGLSQRAPKDRVVSVNRYVATMPKFLGLFKRSPYKTPDEVIYEIAHNKDKQNQMLLKMLKANEKKQKQNQ